MLFLVFTVTTVDAHLRPKLSDNEVSVCAANWAVGCSKHSVSLSLGF